MHKQIAMMHEHHAEPICGEIKHCCHVQCPYAGGQNRSLGGRSQPIRAILPALSTINAVQEQYAPSDGLAMMHEHHAEPICGEIKHCCLVQWSSAGGQNWPLGGRAQLTRAILPALSTINAVQEQYAPNDGLAMMHEHHAEPNYDCFNFCFYSLFLISTYLYLVFSVLYLIFVVSYFLSVLLLLVIF